MFRISDLVFGILQLNNYKSLFSDFNAYCEFSSSISSMRFRFLNFSGMSIQMPKRNER